jgi:hypothetical protein
MYAPADVAKITALIYGVETLCIAIQGETQQLSPESFVPNAVRLLQESAKVQSLGVDGYLADVEQRKATALAEAVADAAREADGNPDDEV